MQGTKGAKTSITFQMLANKLLSWLMEFSSPSTTLRLAAQRKLQNHLQLGNQHPHCDAT